MHDVQGGAVASAAQLMHCQYPAHRHEGCLALAILHALPPSHLLPPFPVPLTCLLTKLLWVQYMVLYKCIQAQMNCTALFLDGSDLSNRQVNSYMAASLGIYLHCSCTCAHMLEMALAKLSSTQKLQ